MLFFRYCVSGLICTMKKVVLPLVLGVVLALGVLFALDYAFQEPIPGAPDIVIENPDAFHIHSDFAVFVNNKRMDFAQEKYMTSTDACQHADEDDHALHLHNLNGNVAHAHTPDKTWVDFFDSIGFKLEPTQLTFDDGVVYKNSDSSVWRFYVNGSELTDLQNHVIQDLDKVLITYGNTTEEIIQSQLNSITNEACIFSKKCPLPEGVVLPPENCGS